MPLKCGSTSTDYHWYQVHTAEEDLATLRRLDVEETHPAYQRVWAQRGAALAKVGYKAPKVSDWLINWASYSPERIRLGRDPEYGWFIAAREKPDAPITYKHVSAEIAVAIIKEEVTPELVKELAKPEEYYGE